MDVIVRSKNLVVSDSLRQFIGKKVEKLGRYLSGQLQAEVELERLRARQPRERHVAQLTLRAGSWILRAEDAGVTARAAVSAAVDKLSRQAVRYKDRLHGQPKGGVAAAARPTVRRAPVTTLPPENGEVESAETSRERIVRVKRFPVRAVDLADAVMQLELLDHDFYVFLNRESGEINVLYRRRDGTYGLLQPEVP
ncbi:MAG TPA: ribosome-associated translation inhibitor RaiA [Chloroflexota bacterium]